MKLRNILLCTVGFLFLSIGSIGIVLPILPTTPFVLLAGICFSIGSPRINEWLKKSKHFGCYIDNYQNHTGVPREVKVHSIQFLWFGLIVSSILMNKIWGYALLAVVGVAVTLHIHSLPTKE